MNAEISAPLRLAWELCAQQRFDDASVVVQDVLRRSPHDADAWGLCARLQLQLGDRERALQSAAFAVQIAPGNAQALYTLGRALVSTGHPGAAETAYRRALALAPGSADMLVSLAIVVRKAGRPDEAVALCRRALELQPRHVEAARNLQAVLTALGAGAAARIRLEAGQAVFSERLVDDLRRAAAGLIARSKLPDALLALKIAVQFRPDDADLWFEATQVSMDLGLMSGTLSLCEEGLQRDPSRYLAIRLARGLCACGGLDERALHHLDRAESLRPTAEHRIVGAIVLPAIQKSAASVRETRRRYAASLDAALAWNWAAGDHYDLLQIPNFYLAYHGENDRDLQVKAARLFLHAMPGLAFVAPHCREGQRRRPGKIRVGFISKYFASHSIGKTSRGLIEKLDRDRFEVHVLRITPTVDDDVSRMICDAADHALALHRHVPMAREEIAALELDILFYQDIGMEPTSWFLAFARLAPLQCVSFGHPNTTGIPTIDYFVSNDLYELPGAQSHYSERLFLLRDLPTLAYYYRPEVPATVPVNSSFGLAPDATLYLCPQTLFKLHPDFDAVIGAILARDPRGVVVLICGEFAEWTTELQARFAATIPAACNRILFLSRLLKADFLGLLAAGTVMLDTLHFNGMNSSLESFAVGTPVVTLPTQLQRGRHTQAMYRRMGISDCIAGNVAEYVDIAVRIGTDPEFARDLRRRILAANHVLYEDLRVVREFERFFLEAGAPAAPAAPAAPGTAAAVS